MLGLHVPCMQVAACVFGRFRLALSIQVFCKMIGVIAMRIISFFYIVCNVSSNSNGEKTQRNQKKTLPYGGNNFINNVLFHFKTCSFALHSLILLISHCIEFVLVTNIEILYQINVKIVNLLNHVW